MKHLQALAERTEKVCEMAAVMKVCSQLKPNVETLQTCPHIHAHSSVWQSELSMTGFLGGCAR